MIKIYHALVDLTSALEEEDVRASNAVILLQDREGFVNLLSACNDLVHVANDIPADWCSVGGVKISWLGSKYSRDLLTQERSGFWKTHFIDEIASVVDRHGYNTRLGITSTEVAGYLSTCLLALLRTKDGALGEI